MVPSAKENQFPDFRLKVIHIRWYADPDLAVPLDTGNILYPNMTEPGIYPYYVTCNEEGCESPATLVKFTINELPDVELGVDTSITDKDILILGPFPVEYKYLWNDGTNDPWFVVDGVEGAPGDRLITVFAATDYCSITDTILVSIQSTIDIATFIPNDIKIYPNPTDGQVIINIGNPVPDDLCIEVFNAGGQMVRKILTDDAKFAGQHLIEFYLEAKGIYVIRIFGDGKYHFAKIVRY